MVRTQFVLDFVLLEEYCNKNCAYCKLEKVQFSPRAVDASGRPVFADRLERARVTLSVLREVYDTPVLVLSGGEVSQFPGFLDVAASVADRYEVIQILTNGESGPQWVADASALIPNLHMKFSLDGHTTAMNCCRGFSDADMAMAEENIWACVERSIPIELNCVLTRHNVGGLGAFIEWLRGFSYEAIQLYAFPVRSRDAMQASARAVADAVDELATLQPGVPPLPPAGHLQALREFFLNGRTDTRCLLPFAVVAGYDTGVVGTCTLVASPRLPCTDATMVSELVNRSELALRPILQESARVPNAFCSCSDCFLDYHIINSALEGIISEEEFFSIPLYSSSAVREKFKQARCCVARMVEDS